MTTPAQEHERMRRELWCRVADATARSDNCTKTESMETFANAALAAFDRRFPAPIPSPTTIRKCSKKTT